MLDRATEVCILLSGFGIGSVALMVIPSPMEVRALTPCVTTTLNTHPCVVWIRPGELAEGVTPGVGSAGQGTRGPRVTLQTPPGVTE